MDTIVVTQAQLQVMYEIAGGAGILPFTEMIEFSKSGQNIVAMLFCKKLSTTKEK